MTSPPEGRPVEELAAAVEADRVIREDAVEVTRAELARILEENRKLHNLRMEERLKERTRQVNKRFLVIFLGMALVFGLLSYRSQLADDRIENNTWAISRGLYDTCIAAASRSAAINPGRTAVVELLVKLVDSDATLTAQQKTDAVTTLREGLTVQIPDCGEAP